MHIIEQVILMGCHIINRQIQAMFMNVAGWIEMKIYGTVKPEILSQAV